MTLTEELKRNELKRNENHGGIGDIQSFSIVRDVNVGDLVELFVDGEFFQRSDGQYEKYAGYVASIDNVTIILSPTHHKNIRHGYVRELGCKEDSEHPRNRAITEIETYCVQKYRVLG